MSNYSDLVVEEIDKKYVKPEVLEALKLAKQHIPPYPTELVKELGAYIGNSPWKQEKPSFWEWTWEISGLPEGRFLNNITASLQEGDWQDGIDLKDIGYFGIWRGRTASKDRPLIWCAMPSMLHGYCAPGETIDIGTERVRIGWKQEDLDAMVKHGYDIMMGMIAERGEYKDNG